MPTSTANFGLLQPLVNSSTDEDLWGNYLNTSIGYVDGLMLTGINMVTSTQTSTFSVTAPTSGSPTTGSANTLFLCNATSGAMAPALPQASTTGNGFTIAFKKTDSSANAVTVTPNNTDTIDGGSTYAMSTAKEWIVLVSDGVSNWNLISQGPTILPTLQFFKVIRTQVFTSTGTYTPNANMMYCRVKLQAAGGSGGGSGGGGSGSGGGAGAYTEGFFSAATIGASQAVTIGANGASASSGSSGNAASASSFGSLMVCNGGSGGTVDVGTRQVGGAGGTVSTAGNVIAINGQQGYGSLVTAYGVLASGGNAVLGFGGQPTSTSGAGGAGAGYGSGGSGNTNGSGNTGAGAPGICIVEEYCYA